MKGLFGFSSKPLSPSKKEYLEAKEYIKRHKENILNQDAFMDARTIVDSYHARHKMRKAT